MQPILVLAAIAYAGGLSIVLALGFGLFAFSHRNHPEQSAEEEAEAQLLPNLTERQTIVHGR